MDAKRDPFDLLGTTIDGKYDIVAVVEETTLSVVYQAMHRLWRRPVAIKAFKCSAYDDEERRLLLHAFVREGALLAELSECCAAICQARDVSSLTTAQGDWVPYMVLEWLEGTTLESMLLEERETGGQQRTLGEAVDLLKPIAAALGVAHQRGIVHRDVKPGNILHLADQRGLWPCKLLDFGIAKVVGSTHGAWAEGADLPSFTPEYGAPEQFSSAYGPTGPWTDVYALALIFVELVAGRPALIGETMSALAIQSCDPDHRPTPATLGVDVGGPTERVLARALALFPRDRFAEAWSFWEQLESAVQEDEEAASDSPFPLVRTYESQSA